MTGYQICGLKPKCLILDSCSIVSVFNHRLRFAFSGHSVSPQTGVLRRTFPTVHVQYSVQENST